MQSLSSAAAATGCDSALSQQDAQSCDESDDSDGTKNEMDLPETHSQVSIHSFLWVYLSWSYHLRSFTVVVKEYWEHIQQLLSLNYVTVSKGDNAS